MNIFAHAHDAEASYLSINLGMSYLRPMLIRMAINILSLGSDY